LVEARVVDKARSMLLDRTRRERRIAVAEALVAVSPKTRSGRTAIARLARDLLDRRLHLNDLDVAIALMPALHDEYSGAQALQRSLERWLSDRRTKLTPDQVRAVVAAGIVINDKFLTKRARGVVDRLADVAEGFGGWIRGRLGI
jgi:hypothetical protein